MPVEPMAVAPKIWRRETLVDASFICATITAVLAVVVCQLRTEALGLPFRYEGDGLFFGANAQTIIETGWVQETDRLGAPFGQKLYDFPVGGDNGNYLIMRLLALGTSDWVLVTNLFYFFTYYSTGLAAYFSFRWLRCGRISSVVASIIFVLAPFHFGRLNHLVLAHYAVIPVAVVLAMRASSGESFRPNVHRFGWAGWLAACIALGSFNAYWAIFGVLSIAFATALSATAHRTLRPLLHGAAFSAVIGVTLVANQAGTLLYQMNNGSNPPVGRRPPTDMDHFALRLIQMITPIPGNRLGFLQGISAKLSQGFRSETTQHLGIVGSGCLLAMLGWVLVGTVRGRLEGRFPAAPSLLAGLAVVWILVASAGGLDWIGVLVGLDRLRGWNRVSIIIMFAALAWASLTVPPLLARLSARTGLSSSALPHAVGVLVLAVGLIDQTSGSYVPFPDQYRETFRSDQAFFAGVEDELPAGASVAELPVRQFPESNPTRDSVDYDLLRPYLHTGDLKWSYGGMKFREAEWQQRWSHLKGVDLVQALSATGFSAVVIDRFGYADRGEELEASLREALGRSPRSSPDRRFSFFSLVEWQSVPGRMDSLAGLRERLLSRPFISPLDCWPFEGKDDERFAWCSASGEFALLTPEPTSTSRVEFEMSTADADGTVTLEVDGRATTYDVGPDGTSVRIDVGRRKDVRVKYTTQVPAADKPRDKRDLRFMITDVRTLPRGPSR